MILDIHTHHAAPQPLGIVDIEFGSGKGFESVEGQCYSAGIHPWNTMNEISGESWDSLEDILQRPEFVAVGEAGIDLSGKGGMLYRQLQIFRRQIDISENLRKPMIVHCVKAEDIICGLIRDLKPRQRWVIHGFRKKPATAEQLLRAGCYISLGPLFNVDTLNAIPYEFLLAETDYSLKSISEVIEMLGNARGCDLSSMIARNSAEFLREHASAL